ncbi:hypothetical protein GGI04_002249 [Coemansia thaxteri]|nr:hypothetical protein GGI04_002249 [Coemansia thaxteri]KAJ2471555.1 hypothetical protein GGI02_002192 [Coemansia sp. RSA 2322]
MRLLSLATLFASAAITAKTTLGVSFASAHPVQDQQRQAAFGTYHSNALAAAMADHYTFDSNAQGPPELSDVLAKEKSATIALDAILRSEALVRAISGDSADFNAGLTLLLPTNKAFLSLGAIPDDLDTVMMRHFIPQRVTLAEMTDGVAVASYKDSASLRFFEDAGTTFVQADERAPTAVNGGAGTQAGNGTYFLVDDLFI